MKNLKIGDIVISVSRGEGWDGIEFMVEKINPRDGDGSMDMIRGPILVNNSQHKSAQFGINNSIGFRRSRLKILISSPLIKVNNRSIFAEKGWGP